MNFQEIQNIRNTLPPASGSPSTEELDYIVRQITAEQPKIFCEVGIASGMSTGIIARAMHESNGYTLHSFDISKYYYADPTKETGFFIPHIFKNDKKLLNLHTEKTAFNLCEFFETQSIDMAFIDANHCHPWPTIDTMLLLPFMRPGAKILHHDISLYLSTQWSNGIGPKHLFDQFVHGQKHLIKEDKPGIGYIHTPMIDYQEYTNKFCTSLLKPWSCSLSQKVYNDFLAFLTTYYGSLAVNVFKVAFQLFNKHPDTQTSNIPQTIRTEKEQYIHNLLEQGKNQQALVAAKNISLLFPHEGWAHILLSFAQVAVGQKKEALESARNAYEVSPVAWGYRYLRLLGENEKWNEVKKFAEEILHIAPQSAYPYRHLAYIELAKGNKNKALEYLNKSLSLAPNDRWTQKDIEKLRMDN